MSNLILILGDQLSPKLSSLRAGCPAEDHVLMAEVWDEATYVPHHKKKIAFLFSAMRHFAEDLRADGWTVTYVPLDVAENSGSLEGEVARLIGEQSFDQVLVTEPGEWRLKNLMEGWTARFSLPVKILADDRFITTHQEFQEWALGRKQLRMEYFYRDMRRKTGLLMDGKEPAGGKWNFDAENRKPPAGGLFYPVPPAFTPDDITRDVLDLVAARFESHIGDLEPFWFAVTRAHALDALEYFIEHALASFGDYQDAMTTGSKYLYHSVLSAYLNAGLLDPLEICQRVEQAYQEGKAPLNAAEGLIRQIIGWREYVRGIYWLKMPDYGSSNFFHATRDLPDFYWTADTSMACIKAAVSQTIEEAYAHHIQRLMVTGNFAMLAGIAPSQVHQWYLAVYADAYEWVEMPNTLGMSQFADGGLLGSKPYAGGGNYINKMSDYCKGCAFDVKQKIGPQACPFNYLYWDFLDRNKDKLEGNPRLGPVYRTWNRMDEDKRAAYLESAETFLNALDGSPSAADL